VFKVLAAVVLDDVAWPVGGYDELVFDCVLDIGH